jgi:peptidase E
LTAWQGDVYKAGRTPAHMPKSKKLPDLIKVELDPKKRYIIFLPTAGVPAAPVQIAATKLQQALRDQGVTGVLVTLDHPENVRIVETPASHDEH